MPTTAQAPTFGTAFGIGLAALVLIPTTLFGYGFAQSLLPVLAALAAMLAGALLAARRFSFPPFFGVFAVVVTSGLLGNTLFGKFDGLTTINMSFLLCAWYFAGNLLPSERAQAAKIFTGAALVLAFIVCIENLVVGQALIAPTTFRYSNPIIGGIRGQGTLAQPLVASFVLLVAFALLARSKAPVVLKVGGVAVLTLATAATGSSSALALEAILIAYLAVTASPVVIRPIVWCLTALIGLLVLTSESLSILTDDLAISANSHRLNSILGVPNLFTERGGLEIVTGSGWNSVQRLYDTNIFYNDFFYAIDNQYVSILALGGLLGTTGLLTICVVALLRRSQPAYVLAFCMVLAMGISFDFILWPVACALFIFTGAALLTRTDEEVTVPEPATMDRPNPLPMTLRPT